MPNKVQSRISTERVSRLEELSDRLHKQFAEKYFGSVRTALFESTEHDGMMYGYTDNYLRVVVPYDASKVNTITAVRLKAFDSEGNITSEIVG